MELPARQETQGPAVSFAPPAHGPMAPITSIDPGSVRRFTVQDHVTGETTYVTEGIGGVFGEGIRRLDDVNIEVAHCLKRELTIRDDDPLSARYVLTQSYEMGRDGWRTLVNTEARMHSDTDNFYVSGTLIARLNGDIVAERQWDVTMPRDLL